MDSAYAVEIVKTMLFQAVMLSAPFLGVAMVVGLAVGLFQAVTSIHEQTLTFVPKAVALVALIIVLLPWILRSLMTFTVAMIQQMPQMVR